MDKQEAKELTKSIFNFILITPSPNPYNNWIKHYLQLIKQWI